MRSASVSFSPMGRPSVERSYNPFSTLWILSSRSEADASQLKNGRDDETSNNVRIAKNLKNPLLSVLNLTRSKTSPRYLIFFCSYARASVSLKFFRLIRTCARIRGAKSSDTPSPCPPFGVCGVKFYPPAAGGMKTTSAPSLRGVSSPSRRSMFLPFTRMARSPPMIL